MDQTSQVAETAERHARWLATWREAVRTSPLAIGLVELSTLCFVDLSPRAAELLRTTPEHGVGLSYLSVTERPQESAETFRLVREKILDGIRGRRRFHRPDGSIVELQVTGWAVRSRNGADLGLWIASEVSDAEHAAAGEDVVAPPLWGREGSDLEGAQMTLDDHWRIAHATTASGVVLGRTPSELLGTSIIELTHADDQAALLLAFARVTTDASSDVRVRLRHQDGSWRTIHAKLTMLDGNGRSTFALVVARVVEPETPNSSDGATQLAGHLRRIAAQIEEAGILAPLLETVVALGVPVTAELSPRQVEIASRLLGGERVPTIAADLYLSQGTVRNHLSAIFQKFGVHSQRELLALWRGSGGRGSVRHTNHRSSHGA
jgi:PAS domain-containing protein/DNA-binding CsgD family transcriptional regulator